MSMTPSPPPPPPPPQSNDIAPVSRKDAISSSNNCAAPNATTEQENRFSRDGYLVSRRQVPAEYLQKWQDFSKAYFRQCFEVLHNSGHIDVPFDRRTAKKENSHGKKISTVDSKPKHRQEKYEYSMGLGIKHGFREIVMRSPGRYELSLLGCREFCPPIDAIQDSIFPLVPHLLGVTSWDELCMCHLSLVVSTASSAEQAWHADGGHASLSEHLPCHVANVFVPLQNVPMELGPTEFRPGTHVYTRNLAPMMLAAKCRKQLRDPVTPELKLGDILVFDYRVLHRGRANLSQHQNRTILVMTFCKPWYKDVLNFPSRSMYEKADHVTVANDENSNDEESS